MKTQTTTNTAPGIAWALTITPDDQQLEKSNDRQQKDQQIRG